MATTTHRQDVPVLGVISHAQRANQVRVYAHHAGQATISAILHVCRARIFRVAFPANLRELVRSAPPDCIYRAECAIRVGLTASAVWTAPLAVNAVKITCLPRALEIAGYVLLAAKHVEYTTINAPVALLDTCSEVRNASHAPLGVQLAIPPSARCANRTTTCVGRHPRHV